MLSLDFTAGFWIRLFLKPVEINLETSEKSKVKTALTPGV